MNAKINAWEKFISNLIPKKGQKELCAFTKLMTGRGFNNSVAGQVLLLSSNVPVTDPKEKADLLTEHILGERNINQIGHQEIKKSNMNALQSTDSIRLNSPITTVEVSHALKK